MFQAGLFVTNFTCHECGYFILGAVYKDQCAEKICHQCFEQLGLATCAGCAVSILSRDLLTHPDGDKLCYDCISASCRECVDCHNFTLNEDCIEVIRSRNWYGRQQGVDVLCGRCADEQTMECYECAARCYRRDVYQDLDGNIICRGCYTDNYVVCDRCGVSIRIEDAGDDGESCYCENCVSCNLYTESFSPAGIFQDDSGNVEIGSERCYGLELETDKCEGYRVLRHVSVWGAKNDCTVQAKEFYSEILSGDAGLKAIQDWGKLADDNDWCANNHAGYHLHLDVRGESDNSKYAIAYAYHRTQEVWLSFVENRRHSGGYCHSIQWSCRDITAAIDRGSSYYHFATHGTRYNWCNIAAICDHTTIEIRLHEGTCDSVEIINWVKAHVRFADWAAKAGLARVREALDNLSADKQFSFIIQEIWKDSNLSAYYSEKARRHNYGKLTESIGLLSLDNRAEYATV